MIKNRFLGVGNHKGEVLLYVLREFIEIHGIDDVTKSQEIVRGTIAEETV